MNAAQLGLSARRKAQSYVALLLAAFLITTTRLAPAEAFNVCLIIDDGFARCNTTHSGSEYFSGHDVELVRWKSIAEGIISATTNFESAPPSTSRGYKHWE